MSVAKASGSAVCHRTGKGDGAQSGEQRIQQLHLAGGLDDRLIGGALRGTPRHGTAHDINENTITLD
jgi:hypothetical protein